MRSTYADKFNHDEDAAGYDADVRDETHPIRAEYAAVLDWVASQTDPGSRSPAASAERVAIDLGAGTGNLTCRLRGFDRIIAVDVSPKMLELARDKLDIDVHVEWIVADLLEFFDSPHANVSAVVSSYAVHHLTPTEKGDLFRRIHSVLTPGGKAVFGDLMFANEQEGRRIVAALRAAGQTELADEIQDEFFWSVEDRVVDLQLLGFSVAARQFSELSWAISAAKR